MNERPVGHKFTPFHTPYHVVQLTIALLKSTFSTIGPEDYPFRYSDDFDKSGIAIDTVYNKIAEVIGNKPTIAIARGNINSGQTVLGDKADMQFPESKYTKTNVIQSSIEFRISTKSHAECEVLCNEFFNFILSCRTLLPRITGIHHINATNLSPVQQSEQDDKIYVSTASLQYTMQYIWYHIDPDEVLDSITIFWKAENVDTELKHEFYEEEPYN